jgi:hypothetical protein
MRQVMAVTGYVEASVARDPSHLSKKKGPIEIRPERNVKDVVIRVAASDVEEVRVGATRAGMTLVQLILRRGAPVETVIRSEATPEGLQAFRDPVLNRVTQEATAKNIAI